MSDGLNIDDLQPRELLSLLNLNAPVSRGVILQRTAEMTAAVADDPQTVKMINATGDKLAEIAARMGSMTLVLDEEGGTDVPLYDATSAVQDDPVLQAQPTYPQEIIEGQLNPVRRRILTTHVGVDSAEYVVSSEPTIEEQRVGWGVGPHPLAPVIAEGTECEQVSNTEELCAMNKRRQACAIGNPTFAVVQPVVKTPAEFSFSLPAKFDNVVSVTLKSLTFPTSVYNIGPTEECCETYSSEPTTPDIVTVIGPDGLPTNVILVQSCSNNNTFLVKIDPGPWQLIPIPPGTYTIKQISAAMNDALEAIGANITIRVNEETGIVTATSTTESNCDDIILARHIAFPAVVKKSFRPNCTLSERVCKEPCDDPTLCRTSPLIGKGVLPEVPTLVLVSAGGLAPILGYANPIFAELDPAAISIGPPEACFEEFIIDNTLQTVVCPPTLKLYFVLNDYQRSNFPTFVGRVGNGATSTNILSEFIMPPGNASGEITRGKHQPIGFPYATRTYFGPVTLSKLTVSVTDRAGNVVDTHGRPFEFVLELERIYNM